MDNSENVLFAVEDKISQVRTRSLDVSFNELYDMYKDGELIIDPEYQRLFRWSVEKQSQFIESLILEMPTPPIFVIEREEGTYELIDGLQRISSYLNFRGILSKNKDGEEQNSLTLEGCDIVKELNNFSFDELPSVLKIRLKRNFIRMEVIRKQSDERLRYHMFKRLNTGGELLSQQEIRNCTIRIYNSDFNEFIINLSQNSDFKQTISFISEEQIERKYEQELVLRFFALKNNPDGFKNNLGDFLTHYMESVTTHEIPFNYAEEKEVFEKTFKLLNSICGETAFSRITHKGNFVSTFMPYYFEALTIGMQPYIQIITPNTYELLTHKITEIKQSDQFKQYTSGGGKTTKRAFDKRVEFVNTYLGGAF